MRDVYSGFEDQVPAYAIGVDPTESFGDLVEARAEIGFNMPVAQPEGSMLADLRVLIRSTKIGIDSEGIIIYRGGYSSGGEGVWEDVFHELAGSGAR